MNKSCIFISLIVFIMPQITLNKSLGMEASHLHGKDDKPSVFGALHFMEKIDIEKRMQLLVEKFKVSACIDERLKLAKEHICLFKSLPNNTPKIAEYPNYPSDHEIFETIDGYGGVYMIGNWGTFKRKERFYIRINPTGSGLMAMYHGERVLKQGYHTRGYPQSTACIDGICDRLNTHRLVGIYFVPNPNNLLYVCHKDDNPKNPKWDNLFWGTPKDNTQDSISKGRWSCGETHAMAKLSDAQIPEIRKLISEGKSLRKIAATFGVDRRQISRIKNGKSWGHIK